MYMKISELKLLIDKWAPPGVAWDRDNPGLQVGDPTDQVSGILLAFDATSEAVKYAKAKKYNLIITHHPLLFHSVKNINTSRPGIPSVLKSAIKNDITVLSYHTNLDFTSGGVSFALAEKLGLKKIQFLEPVASKRNKLVVFVPADSFEKIADAVFNVGGGVIGAYRNCSFSSKGTGTFFGEDNSTPVLGEKGQIENVEEVRLEILFNEWDREAVLRSIYQNHPYEQPAVDIYKVENLHENFGSGAIGELENEISEKDFLQLVAKRLNVPALRHNALNGKKVKKVALCGGAGEEYYKRAITLGADAYVTADIRYHNFIDSAGSILLVDAGHYETEAHILENLKIRIEDLITGKNIPVEIYSENANPVFYYINEE